MRLHSNGSRSRTSGKSRCSRVWRSGGNELTDWREKTGSEGVLRQQQRQ